MCFQVICLNNRDITNTLLRADDGIYFATLFTLLNCPAPLDNYLSGYLEKIIDTLNQTEYNFIAQFLNNSGVDLFSKFLNHIQNYSIMQILKNIMYAPALQAASEQSAALDKDLDPLAPIEKRDTCNWSYLPSVSRTLCSRLLDVSKTERVSTYT